MMARLKKFLKPDWKSAVVWSVIRAALFLAIAITLGMVGNHLRPREAPQLSVTEPRITVLTNQQSLPAAIDMSLSASPDKNHLYDLTLTITPTIQVPANTVVEVWFGDVPDPASSIRVGELSSRGQKEYSEIAEPAGGTTSHAPAYAATYSSAQQIGENTAGGRIRVAFPDLVGERPGPQFSTLACSGSTASVLQQDPAICASLGIRASTMWVPVLQAGQSTLTSGGLAGYQYLAGDAPTLLGDSGWTWTGINGATVLAASVAAEDTQQNNLFYSGIWLGVAASAAIAFLTELLRPVWRKDPP
jgi:hypothetical protein